MKSTTKKLFVLIGPTAVGKTQLSLDLAQMLSCPIISADSRQLYRQLSIGTAAPTEEELQATPHYFIHQLDLCHYYNAAQYESEALSLIDILFKTHNALLVTGGSMMYIDALCYGIDDLPTVDPQLRADLEERLKKEGLEPLTIELQQLDPIYYQQVDLKNHKRVLHALEICLMTGKAYSSLRTRTTKQRPFQIIKIGLKRDREELYQRINQRVDKMIDNGLIDEVRSLLPYRHLNSLNTVGYKELFPYFDQTVSLDYAIEKIKQHSRIYAKKQMTWFKKDPSVQWFHPHETEAIKDLINKEISL